MSTLDSITERRLNEFGRRRNTLLTLRGFSIALLILFVACLLCMPLDAWLILSDTFRWATAIAIYSLVGIIVFAMGVSPWLRGRSRVWLAELFEKQEPQLRNRLLSAVELSASGNRQLDSASFRETVQRDVAKRLEGIHVTKVLPWKMIRPWVLMSSISCCIAALLCFIPGLHFATRMGRVLFPMANIGRVSAFAVRIVEPSPGTRATPENEVVSIVSEVTPNFRMGDKPSTVTLEIEKQKEQATDELSSLSMREATQPSSKETVETASFIYSVNLPMGDKVIRYRVVADGANTPWYELTPRPRPEITEFEITYQYPEYTLLPKSTAIVTSADCVAVEGTKATLALSVNQAIREGKIRIENKKSKLLSKKSTPSKSEAENTIATTEIDELIPLQRRGEQWVSDFDLQRDATFRIEMVADETKFTNPFSKPYSLRSIIDKDPKIRLIEPKQSTMAATADQLLVLRLETTDELPIASLTEQFRVGSGEWLEHVIDTKKLDEFESAESRQSHEVEQGSVFNFSKPVRQNFSLSFDMSGRSLKVGDYAQLRYVATDRKGQSVRSSTLEFYISEAALATNRYKNLDERLALTKQFQAYRDKLESNKAAIQEAKEKFQQQPDSADAREAFLAQTQRFATEASKSTSELRDKLLDAIRNEKNNLKSTELEQLSRLLSRIDSEVLPTIQHAAKVDRESDDYRRGLEKARDAIDQATGFAQKLAKRSKDFTAHDILAQTSSDIGLLQKYQDELNRSIDTLLPEQFRRRQELVARHLREVSSMLRDRAPMLRDGVENQATQWADQLFAKATQIEALTGTEERPKPAPESGNERRQLAENISQELKGRTNAFNIDGGIQWEMVQARNELNQQSQTAWQVVEQLKNQVALMNNEQERDRALSEMESVILPRLQQLAQLREVQQLRSDGDSQFTADLGTTMRAALKVAESIKTNPKEAGQKLDELQKQIRKLEAIHQIDNLGRLLDQLHDTERWKSTSPEMRFEQPKAFDAFKQMTEQTTQALRESGLNQGSNAEKMNEVIGKIDSLRWNDKANAASQKIDPRRWSNDSIVPAAEEFHELQRQLIEQRKVLEPTVKELRDRLKEMAPSVSELARSAASEMESLASKTDDLKKLVEEGNVPDPRIQISRLEKDRQSKQPALDQVRDALADLASRQDMMQTGSAKVARDADAAASITTTAQQQVQESIAKAKETLKTEETVGALEDSKNTQIDAAEALETIASHFESLDQESQGLAKSGESLDQSKQAGALADAAVKAKKLSELESVHDDIDRLRKLSKSDPASVLAQLEKELPKNSAMQNELSKIATEAIKQTEQTLNFTARQEARMAIDIENSDEAFKQQKERLVESMRRSADLARRVADSDIQRLKSSADRAKEGNAKKDLDRARNDLHKSAGEANSVNLESSIDDIAASAKNLGRSLEQINREVKRNQLQFNQATDKEIETNEDQQKNRKREAEDLQKRYRNEDIEYQKRIEREQNERVKQAERKVEQLSNSVNQQRNQVADMQRQVEQQPENEGWVRELERRKNLLAPTLDQMAIAESDKNFQQQKFQSTQQQLQTLQEKSLDDLNAKNPFAESGSRLSTETSEKLRDSVEQLRESLAAFSPSANQNASASLPSASKEALQSSTQKQDSFKDNVLDATESLARAARHEMRLANNDTASALNEKAESIRATANEQMQKASNDLENASKNAKESQAKQNGSSEGSEVSNDANMPSVAKASTESTRSSQQSVAEAEKALREQSESLKDMLNPKSTSAQKKPSQKNQANGNVAQNKNDSGSGKKPILSPDQMARMLDELDQQVNRKNDKRNQSEGTASKSSSASKKSPSPGQSSSSGATGEASEEDGERAATLAEAARQLASQLNQQRQSMSASSKATTSAPKNGMADSNSRNATRPGEGSSAIVLPVDVVNKEDWGKLREQIGEDAIEAAREGISPAYRKQVEEYYRVLSKKRNKQ